MANTLRYLGRRSLLGVADYAVTMPIVRWTWTGPSEDDLIPALGEFRPTDRESVLEMMAGRYLLASKLIDTHGVSPFSVESCQRPRPWSSPLAIPSSSRGASIRTISISKLSR